MPNITVYVSDKALRMLRDLREKRKESYGRVIENGCELLESTEEVARI